MAQLAKIETAKVPANAIAGVKVPAQTNVVSLNVDDTAYQRLGVLVLLLVFGIFVAWSALAPLGSHAVASGKVMVNVKKQVVQHREGGVIEDIFVTDGDQVEQGQKLMVISPTEAKSDQATIYEQLLGAIGLEARLNASLEGHDSVNFPDELKNTRQAEERAAEIVADESQQFKVNKATADAEVAILTQRVAQLKEQIAGIDKQIVSQRALGASYQKEVVELQSLFSKKLISNLQLNESERNLLNVNTSIAELESNKASLKVQIGEAQEQLVLQENNRKKESAAQLSEVRLRIADLRNRLAAVSDRLDRTIIVAPKAGTVVNLAYHTKGGVVQSGSPVMEIVPKTDAFEVEARVNISDIDKVHAGLEADIRFPAFAQSSFLKVTPGVVDIVSADSIQDEASHSSFYIARVKIKPEGIAELQKRKLELVQGMPAEVSIKTGERTFLDYLLKPLTNMMNHAFNED